MKARWPRVFQSCPRAPLTKQLAPPRVPQPSIWLALCFAGCTACLRSTSAVRARDCRWIIPEGARLRPAWRRRKGLPQILRYARYLRSPLRTPVETRSAGERVFSRATLWNVDDSSVRERQVGQGRHGCDRSQRFSQLVQLNADAWPGDEFVYATSPVINVQPSLSKIDVAIRSWHRNEHCGGCNFRKLHRKAFDIRNLAQVVVQHLSRNFAFAGCDESRNTTFPVGGNPTTVNANRVFANCRHCCRPLGVAIPGDLSPEPAY